MSGNDDPDQYRARYLQLAAENARLHAEIKAMCTGHERTCRKVDMLREDRDEWVNRYAEQEAELEALRNATKVATNRDSTHALLACRTFAVACVAAGAWSVNCGRWNDPAVGFALVVLMYYFGTTLVWLWRRISRKA
jgi:hypothetical protein